MILFTVLINLSWTKVISSSSFGLCIYQGCLQNPCWWFLVEKLYISTLSLFEIIIVEIQVIDAIPSMLLVFHSPIHQFRFKSRIKVFPLSVMLSSFAGPSYEGRYWSYNKEWNNMWINSSWGRKIYVFYPHSTDL